MYRVDESMSGQLKLAELEILAVHDHLGHRRRCCSRSTTCSPCQPKRFSKASDSNSQCEGNFGLGIVHKSARPISGDAVVRIPVCFGLHSKLHPCRWAVKEAAYKAMYPAFMPTWKELSYRGLQPNGQKPTLLYEPLKSSVDTKGITIHASISHDGDYVFASVLVES